MLWSSRCYAIIRKMARFWWSRSFGQVTSDLGIVKDYWEDQKSADQSTFSFARMFQKFMEWRGSPEYNSEDDQCFMRINVLAHSMGNRVLRQMLSNWHKYDQPNKLPLLFRNAFLVAANILKGASN